MRTIRIFVIVALLAAGLASCSSDKTSPVALGRVVSCESITSGVSDKGPLLPCLDGGTTVDVGALAGPLIVNVWGSWCGPCKEEIPIFRNFYQRNKSKIQILGVDVEEAKPADGKEFVISEGVTWPNVIDTDGRSRAFFGMGVPVTWFINSQGKIVYKKIGALKDENELMTLTAKYLNINVS
jgi:cytochrome c biogenesis protein CcmG/thiol:disulfide interchange protein DsbE